MNRLLCIRDIYNEGRELKVHTTDYVEEGQEVGLTFEVEDIHVMEKMGF